MRNDSIKRTVEILSSGPLYSGRIVDTSAGKMQILGQTIYYSRAKKWSRERGWRIAKVERYRGLFILLGRKNDK